MSLTVRKFGGSHKRSLWMVFFLFGFMLNAKYCSKLIATNDYFFVERILFCIAN